MTPEYMGNDMIIDLDSKHRIIGRTRSWDLQTLREITKGKRAGEIEWKTLGYFTTFARALSEAAQREIRTNPAHGMAEAIEALQALSGKYGAIFEGWSNG
jgi:hypothetical protein